MRRKCNIKAGSIGDTGPKLICPDCSAVIVAPRPELMVWERCPSCGSHIWDDYDIMMAEIVQTGAHTGYSKPIGKEHIN